MNSKERVHRGFHFNNPDRIPKTAFGLNTDFFPFMCVHPKKWQPTNYPPHVGGGPNGYKSLLNRWFIMRWHWKKKYRKNLKLPRKWWNVESGQQLLTVDEWGILWSSGGAYRDVTMGHPIKGPLEESWDAFETYKFPDATDKSRYRFWTPLIKSLSRGKYIMGVPNLCLFHNLASWLRGFHNLMIDFVKNPKKVDELVKRITDFYSIQVQMLKEKCPKMDAIFCFDDLGTQKSPFVSPQMFRRFFGDSYKKIIDLTHDLGMDFMLHSCGQIKELIPVFVDLGVDVMEFDSPKMTGVENFKQYAEQQKMAFFLSSNIQTTFSQGSPQEIDEEIKYYVKEVGNNHGGLAFYEYLDHKVLQVPKENVRALHKAFKKYGNYNKAGVIDWLA